MGRPFFRQFNAVSTLFAGRSLLLFRHRRLPSTSVRFPFFFLPPSFAAMPRTPRSFFLVAGILMKYYTARPGFSFFFNGTGVDVLPSLLFFFWPGYASIPSPR